MAITLAGQLSRTGKCQKEGRKEEINEGILLINRKERRRKRTKEEEQGRRKLKVKKEGKEIN